MAIEREKVVHMENLTEMSKQVAALRQAAENLARLGSDFPALASNTVRVLACIRMMELDLPPGPDSLT